MPFQPGNKYGKGQPKKLKTQIKDFIKAYPNAVATLMQVLYDKGIAGDKEAATYVIDRIQGKPKISVDSQIKHQLELTAEDILMVRQLSDRENEAFITQSSPLQIIEGEDDANH